MVLARSTASGRPSASPLTRGMSSSFAAGASSGVGGAVHSGTSRNKKVLNVDNLLVKRKRCPVEIKNEMPSIKNSILYDYGSVLEETNSVLG